MATVKLSDKSNIMIKGAHGNTSKKRNGKHQGTTPPNNDTDTTTCQKFADAATRNWIPPPKTKETTKAEHRDSSPDYRHDDAIKTSTSKDDNVPETHSCGEETHSPPAQPGKIKNNTEEANANFSKIKYHARSGTGSGGSIPNAIDEDHTCPVPRNKPHRNNPNHKSHLRRNHSHGKRRVKKEHDTTTTVPPPVTDYTTPTTAIISNSSSAVDHIGESQAPLSNDTDTITNTNTNTNGKEQPRSDKGNASKRKPYRGKQKSRHGKSTQEEQGTDDGVHHTLVTIPSDDPNMKESSKQTDTNHVEEKESIHHVKTNAVGLAILNYLSGSTPEAPPFSTVEDHFDSMEVNRSSAEKSDSLLTEEMSRIDLCTEQDEGHYSNEIMDDGNGNGNGNAMNDNEIINHNEYMNNMNGYYPPQPMIQQHQQQHQHQQHQPMMMMMMPPGAEYHPMVQHPTVTYGVPCEQYMMPQTYDYSMPFDGYQNGQGDLNQAQLPTSGPPMMYVPQVPLRYEQVTMGGTVFFNPVYTEDEVEEKEENKMQGRGSNDDANEVRTKIQKKKKNTSRKKKNQKNRGSKAPAAKKEKQSRIGREGN